LLIPFNTPVLEQVYSHIREILSRWTQVALKGENYRSHWKQHLGFYDNIRVPKEDMESPEGV
jgi:hypothetical protein